jgi:hypothetical protein
MVSNSLPLTSGSFNVLTIFNFILVLGRHFKICGLEINLLNNLLKKNEFQNYRIFLFLEKNKFLIYYCSFSISKM